MTEGRQTDPALARRNEIDREWGAQTGTQTVKIAIFVGDGHQSPVTVSGGDFVYENRGGLSFGRFRRRDHPGEPAGQHRMSLANRQSWRGGVWTDCD
jgi:hypothetical protein